jgi:hypothetical protein
MKKLVLTGLANETDFTNGEAIQYLLVFNKGELRVPVDEQSAKLVIQFMFSDEEIEPKESEPKVPEDQNEFTDDEGGVDQV